MMSYYQKLAAFLEEFMSERNAVVLPSNPFALAVVIRMLISLGVTTPEELRREALRRYDIIIRDEMFQREVL